MELINILAYPVLILVIVILVKLTIERHYLKVTQYEQLKKTLYEDISKVVEIVNSNTKTVAEISEKIATISSKVNILGM